MLAIWGDLSPSSPHCFQFYSQGVRLVLPAPPQVQGTAFKLPIFLQTWKRDVDGWRLAVEAPLRPLDASAPLSPPVAAKGKHNVRLTPRNNDHGKENENLYLEKSPT